MRSDVSAPYVFEDEPFSLNTFVWRQLRRLGGVAMLAGAAAGLASLATWNVADPSFSHATADPTTNAMGYPGAVFSDLAMQFFGLASVAALAPLIAWGLLLFSSHAIGRLPRRLPAAFGAGLASAGVAGCVAPPPGWPLPSGLGGVFGDLLLYLPSLALGGYPTGLPAMLIGAVLCVPAGLGFLYGGGLVRRGEAPAQEADEADELADEEPLGMSLTGALFGLLAHWWLSLRSLSRRAVTSARGVEPDWKRRRPADERSWRRAAEAVEEAELAESGGEEQARRAGMEARARIEPEFFAALVADARQQPAPDAWEGSETDSIEPVRAPPAAAPIAWDEPRRPRAPSGPNTQVRAYRTPSPSALREAARREEERALARGRAPAPVEPSFEETRGEQSEEEFAADLIAEGAVDDAAASFLLDEPGAGLAPFSLDEDDEAPPQHSDVRRSFAREASGMPAATPLPGSAAALPRVKIPAPSRALTPEAPAVPVSPMHAARLSSARELAALGAASGAFEMPALAFLSEPKAVGRDPSMSMEALQENARMLESVLDDFGVKGEIIQVRPGPVVTLYELEPAPGIKSSRVIGLADDIARSMSAIAARVAVVPGRNAIGIELPNSRRETVYLREMLSARDFNESPARLALALGKTINGDPVVVDIAKMPHVLVAGTTGSGKSVAINTMVLSLLYKMTPEECRLIMIDPKMVELSVYDGIPHLLTPVVTDPKKAVVALKWTVREMEDRYRKMAKVGVRNIDGFNARVAAAAAKGEPITRTVQTGFDRHTGEAVYETEEMDLEPFPFIVVIIDEVADLMMVAGKDIEGAVQRLGQMARAAGIHVIMATQRPSVDVITGTIKANFPTRMSFQVTSKIDSRTILGEQGAEQLLGQGDMLYMAGGGRIQRVHGPFVSDIEVEKVVAHLKLQGAPEYLDAIVADDDEEDDEDDAPRGKKGAAAADGEMGSFDESEDPYDQAVAVVLRDGKASTSYIQRRLGIGYNRAASLIERMEKEGIVGPANHAGKREILVPTEEDKI
jgi:DNA segregation ATPase FtsK/SpoIIIE, S-DNA-T family